MGNITPDQARAFMSRWRHVEAGQWALERAESMELKLRQLSTLMTSRGLFGSDPDRDSGVLQVRDRWLRIRESSRD